MPTNTHANRANKMPPAFGTSGLRGLVTDLTDELVRAYCHAFTTTLPSQTVYVGRDLRPSSPRIAEAVTAALIEAGIDVIDCGAICTPALAHLSMSQGAGAVMVTGSHIPADRNGLKFYVPSGEITKADEAMISAAYATGYCADPVPSGRFTTLTNADAGFIDRYLANFAPDTLAGQRIGLYQHSSVARDMLATLLTKLGASVIPLGRSDTFIPVDTEATSAETQSMLAAWCAEHALDAIVSTDGDGDRPLVTDETGTIILGDILGLLTARYLGATQVVMPVTSNAMIAQQPHFEQVHLTQIGSPYVIAGMDALQPAKVVGFEPNGGFLLGFQAGQLAPLMTRDCVLPMLSVLATARSQNISLAQLVGQLPNWFSAADRIQNIDRTKAAQLIATLTEDETERAAFFAPFGTIEAVDLTDGLRVTLAKGALILHLRLSGNAPEFRVYAQAADQTAATANQRRLLELVGGALAQSG
jgi:phosphomannomutase